MNNEKLLSKVPSNIKEVFEELLNKINDLELTLEEINRELNILKETKNKK